MPRNWGWWNGPFYAKLRGTRRCSMQKKYIVRLSRTERDTLQQVVRRFKGSSREGATSADASESRRKWQLIGRTVISPRLLAVERRQWRWFGNVLSNVVFKRHWKERNAPLRPPRSSSTASKRPRSSPLVWVRHPRATPTGRSGSLARKVVELEIVEAISYETVRRTLKKTE